MEFVNDLTNNNLSFDRNYIRKKIIPNIKDRWNHLNKAISHTISLQNDYAVIAQEYCSMIYNSIIIDEKLSIRKLNNYFHLIFMYFYQVLDIQNSSV